MHGKKGKLMQVRKKGEKNKPLKKKNPGSQKQHKLSEYVKCFKGNAVKNRWCSETQVLNNLLES